MKQSLSRRTRRTLIESLETRRLLTFSLVTPISDVSVTNHNPSTISLANHFHDSSATNTTVLMHIQPYNAASAGADLYVQLSDTVTPQTVANFLAYVNAGRYNNTIIHRSVSGFVVQGGGYLNDGAGLNHISTFSPVVNEFTQAQTAAGGPGNPVNVRGTIAMAKVGGDPDSATSEWFFNLADNSSNLDNQNGGFTTFGTVVAPGMTGIVDTIAALPQTNLGGAFTNLPLAGSGAGNYSNLVTLTYVTAECVYTISTNTNASLFSSVSIVGSQLVLNYAPGKVGSADLTVTATDFSGHTATDTFTVTVTQPIISVTTGGAAVTDGQSSAINLGNPTQGATVSKTFRVTNNGNANLTFTAPTVPSGYAISSPADLSAVTLAPGEFVDVVVNSIATNTGGSKTGTLVINSNDPSTGAAAFEIPLTYTVLTRQVSVTNNSSALTNNQSLNLGTSAAASFTTTLVVKNNGTGTLTLSAPTLPAGYSIDSGYSTTLAAGASTNLVLRVNTSTNGVKSGAVVINTDDPNTPAFTLNVTATVSHGTTSVALVNPDTTTTPLSGAIDYGFIDQNSITPNSKTFRITNTGTATLTFSSITEPAGFFITSPSRTFHAGSPSTPPNLGSLAPGASIDITITQRSDTGGDKSGTLYLNTNDPNTPAYGIQLAGFTHYRKIEVSYSSTNLVPNSSTHVTSQVNLGSGAERTTYQVNFHITNTGDTLDLILTAPTLPAGFSLVSAFPGSVVISPGQSYDIAVAVDTTSPGTRSGTIVFNSNDPVYALPASAPGFRVPVTAVVNYRRLAVTDTSNNAVSSGTSAYFGTILQGDTAQFTYRLTNTGNLPLNLSNPTLPAGFVLGGTFPTTIAPGATAEIVISLDTLGRGTYAGAFTFGTDDPTRPTFVINLAGKVVAKGIVVALDGNVIPYGEATTVDFGTVRRGSTGNQVTLTVSNSGLLPLSFQSTSLPVGYTLVQSLPDTLAPGASAQLTISLDTTTPGYYEGTLHIVSSDPDRPSFDIPLSAAVTLPVKLGAGGVPSVTFTDADGTLSTITMTGPGSATLDFLGNNLVANTSAKVRKALTLKGILVRGLAAKGVTVTGSSVVLSGITLEGTSAAKTTLTVTSKGGRVKTVDIGDVSGSALLSLSAPAGRLVGGVAIKVGTLNAASAVGATLQLANGATVNIPVVSNTTLTTPGNLKSLTVNSWTGGAINAKAIDNLTVNGNINTSLTVKKAVAKATVKGNLAGGEWTVGGLTKIAVSGNVAKPWVGTVNGAVGSFTVGKSFSGSLTAKVLSLNVTGSVNGAALTAKTSLASLFVKGVFANTNVTAKAIANATIGTLKTHNGGNAFVISSPSIKVLAARLDTGKSIKLTGVNSKSQLTAQLAAQKAGSLNDLQIAIG